MTLHWQRTTAYSQRARGTDYHVSRSHGAVDLATGEQETRYSAWHGPLLREQDRATRRMPTLIGVYATAAEARAACAVDCAEHPERAPLDADELALADALGLPLRQGARDGAGLDITVGGRVDWSPARAALRDALGGDAEAGA